MALRTLILAACGALLVVLFAACGSSNSAPAGSGSGNPQAGEQLFFQTQQLAGAPTCSTCHKIDPDEPAVVAPNLNGIAIRAQHRVPGQTAEAYLRESILDPYAYIVEGYESSIMVRTYGDQLSEQQIRDLLAYLLTLD